MAIAINGDGTITGISVGGLPDGVVDAGTLATNSVDSAELVSGSVDSAHLAGNIDATKLADGTVTSTELQYINSLSSNAQTQISAAGGSTTTGFAAGLSAVLNDVTGDGTMYDWRGATWGELYDNGSNFSSGAFTAPVTGKYIFVLHFYTSTLTSSHTMCLTSLVTSNRTYTSSKFNPYAAYTGADIGFQDTIIADMDACDIAYIYQRFENGGKTVDFYSTGSADVTYNYFVGALVHE